MPDKLYGCVGQVHLALTDRRGEDSQSCAHGTGYGCQLQIDPDASGYAWVVIASHNRAWYKRVVESLQSVRYKLVQGLGASGFSHCLIMA